MAVHSPVLIASSSPSYLRVPTATPPGSRRHSNCAAISSSPHLPSPSAFLKSGSTGASVANTQNAAVYSRFWLEQPSKARQVEAQGLGAANGGAIALLDSKSTKKRSAKVEGAPARPPAKRPRKRKYKSESIIIDSDEPNGAGDSVPCDEALTRPVTIQDKCALELLTPRVGANELPTLASDPGRGPAQRTIASPLKTRPTYVDSFENPEAAESDDMERPQTAASCVSVDSEVPCISLTTLVSGFGYDAAVSIPSPERTAVSPVLTSRRRIELADASTVAPTRKAADMPRPAAAKRQTSPKKKPQTITSLATEPFRPQVMPPSAQVQASPPGVTKRQNGGEHATPADKIKKPRKSRAKKAGDVIAAKKAAKREPTPELFTPQRARAREQAQAFLFGTSSQLATEESPAFIRDMMVALKESEDTPPSQVSPTRKSCRRVPTAPHGTSLSVEQAHRELWCTSARDSGGNVLLGDVAVAPGFGYEAPDTRPVLLDPPSPQPDQVGVNRGIRDAEIESQSSQIPGLTWRREIERSSSMRSSPDLAAVPDRSDLPDTRFDGVITTATQPNEDVEVKPRPLAQSIDDEWQLLSSETSCDGLSGQTTGASMAPQPLGSESRSNLSCNQIAPLIQNRPALTVLDSNVHLLRSSPQKSSIHVRHRLFTTTACTEVRKKTVPAPKGRGRPKKDAQITVQPMSPARKRRGRPPKEKPDVSALSTRSECRVGKNVAPPTKLTKTKDWTNIDEISDSDSPCTPSPTRRRASTSPSAVRPLELSRSASPSMTAKASAIVTSALKPTDEEWKLVATALFPQITKTVQSSPRSDDLKQPSWHQKILLYDPIVLEDLTAWLNAQGLRVETRRPKPQARAKGRKKKEVEPGDRVPEVEYDTCHDALKPWMVQRWCEEKSICCLWKEGLRGGVRTKY